jgi:predicted small secreted protein
MLKLRVFIYILALLLVSLMISGCYTVIGYPPNVNDLTVKKDAGHKQL